MQSAVRGAVPGLQTPAMPGLLGNPALDAAALGLQGAFLGGKGVAMGTPQALVSADAQALAAANFSGGSGKKGKGKKGKGKGKKGKKSGDLAFSFDSQAEEAGPFDLNDTVKMLMEMTQMEKDEAVQVSNKLRHRLLGLGFAQFMLGADANSRSLLQLSLQPVLWRFPRVIRTLVIEKMAEYNLELTDERAVKG